MKRTTIKTLMIALAIILFYLQGIQGMDEDTVDNPVDKIEMDETEQNENDVWGDYLKYLNDTDSNEDYDKDGKRNSNFENTLEIDPKKQLEFLMDIHDYYANEKGNEHFRNKCKELGMSGHEWHLFKQNKMLENKNYELQCSLKDQQFKIRMLESTIHVIKNHDEKNLDQLQNIQEDLGGVISNERNESYTVSGFDRCTSRLCKTKNNVLHLILYEFLSLRDVLKFQKSCKSFHNLVESDENNMTKFAENIHSKDIKTTVDLDWFDVRYFLSCNLSNSFDPQKVFNIKKYHYAIVLKSNKIISFSTLKVPFFKKLFSTVPKILVLNESTFSSPMTPIKGNEDMKKLAAWFKIDPTIRELIFKFMNGSLVSRDMYADKLQREIKSWPNKNPKKLHLIYTIIKNIVGRRAVGPFADPTLFPLELNEKKIKMIADRKIAWAAILDDNTVCAWGDPKMGGKIPPNIQEVLKNVKKLFVSNQGFIALLGNGSILHWGRCDDPLIPTEIHYPFDKIQMVFENGNNFAVILNNGNVFSWGKDKISMDIQKQLKNVKLICTSGDRNLGALTHDGKVFTWPYSQPSGLEKVSMLFSNQNEFAALFDDGSVFIWTNGSSKIEKKFENVTMLFADKKTFVALFIDGHIEEFGKTKIPQFFVDELKGRKVEKIFPKIENGFIVIYTDGKVFKKIEW